MADRLSYNLDINTGQSGKALSDLAKAAKALGTELDSTAPKGSQVASALSASADVIKAQLKSAEQAAEALGQALGPELSNKIANGAGFDRLLEDLRGAGLEFDDIRDNADQLAASIKKLDSASSGMGPLIPSSVTEQADRATTSVRAVGHEADNSRSVLANMVGNSAQDLGQLSGVAGTAGVAIGQLAEYAADGNISLAGFAKVAGPMAVIGVVTGVIATHMEAMAKAKAFETARVDAFAKALKDGATAAQAWDAALSGPQNNKVEWIDATNDKTKDLTHTLAENQITWEDMKGHLGEGREAFNAWIESSDTALKHSNDRNAIWQAGNQILDQQEKATRATAESNFVFATSIKTGLPLAQKFGSTWNDARTSLEDWTGEAGDAELGASHLAAATDKATKAAEQSAKWQEYADKLGQVASAADLARQNQDNFASALEAGASSASGSLTANLNLDESYASLRQSFHDNGRSVDVYTEKGRKNVHAILETGAAIRGNLLQQLKDSGGSYDQVSRAAGEYTGQLTEQLKKAHLTDAQIAEYIHTLGLTPEQVETAIKLSGQETAKSQLDTLNVQLDDIPGEYKAEYIADINRGDFIAAQQLVTNIATALGKVPKTVSSTVTVTTRTDAIKGPKASGGPVRKGEAYLVGDGPGGVPTPWSEIFIPDSDGTILSAPQTRSALRGQSRATGGSTTRNITHITQPAPQAAGAGVPAVSTDDAVKEQDRLQAALYETGRISVQAYKDYVQGRLAQSKDLSDDYLSQFRLLGQLTDTEKQKAKDDAAAADASIQKQDDIQKAMFETGAISLQAYQDYLKGRLGSYEQFSTDWMSIYNDLKGVNEQQVREQADLTKGAYEQAQANKAAAEAQSAVNQQVNAVLAAGAEGGRVQADRHSTDADRAQAVQRLVDEENKLADIAYKSILASATQQGLAVGTVPWDRYVRGLLQEAINAYNGQGLTITGSLLAGDLSGIPALAQGGIVPATPGGRLVRVAEAGKAEAVVPLDSGFGTTHNHYHIELHSFSKPTPREVGVLAEELARLQRRNGRSLVGV